MWWLKPQVGVKVTASGAQIVEGAVCVETVDTSIAPNFNFIEQLLSDVN